MSMGCDGRRASMFRGAWMSVVFVVLAAGGASLEAQPQGDGGGAMVAPDQLIDEALKKIENGDGQSLQEAAVLVRKARILKPSLDKIKLAEGLLAIGDRRQVEAIARLEEYNKSEEGRNDYRGFQAVGNIYKTSLMYRQAAPALERAKGLTATDEEGRRLKADIAIDLAFVYFNLKRKDESLRAAQEAEQLAPEDPKIQLRLGQVAANTEEQELATRSAARAVEQLTAAIQTDPLKRENYSLLQGAYQLQGNMYQRQLSSLPKDGSPYFHLAGIMRSMADNGRRVQMLDARDTILQALSREPENSQYLLFAARLEADLGAEEEALERIEQVLRASPDHEEAAKLREALQRLPRNAVPGGD